MLTKLTYGYLAIVTAAPVAGIFTDHALAIVAITVTLNWIVVPRIARCARRMGISQGYDQGLEEAELIITAELDCRSTMNGARADALAE